MDYSKRSIRGGVQKLPADVVQHIEAVLTSESAKSFATNVLLLAGVLGVIGLAFTAPNTLRLLRRFSVQKHGSLTAKDQKQKLLKTIYYLKQSGQIDIKEEGKGFIARLTEKGQKRFKRIQESHKTIPKPNIWSGTWWLVAADIPTASRIAAEMFRLKLAELQFYPLQRTLWLHPYDPRAELEYFANKYQVGQFITVMEVKRIDSQDKKKLVKFFKQKKVL
ncbi:MAG: hypothetical protein KBD66_00930 [Candidatus Doudnabacteria bacterium]|nr:hypothetical protein [Candidatus Doudnabacteria bacterium]